MNRAMRSVAALLPSIGLCALGVLPIGCVAHPPRVERSPTTGEKLRAIDAARRGDESWYAPDRPAAEVAARRTRVSDWCADLRARLLGNPPSMYAEVDCDRAPGLAPIAVEAYPHAAPRLYAPVERERADLLRAHAARLLSDEELAESLATLAEQAKRPAFRARSEAALPRVPPSGEWLRQWLDSYANIERIAGAELPHPDPNAPAARAHRLWREPDFWVDPKRPAPRP